MPIYSYKCSKCDKISEIRHSLNDIIENVPGCNKGCALTRIPSFIFVNDPSDKKKTGSVVKETIEQTKEDISRFLEKEREYK